MANQWVEHVKAYAKKHGINYRVAMKEAKDSYKPVNKDKVTKEKKPKLEGLKKKKKLTPKESKEVMDRVRKTVQDQACKKEISRKIKKNIEEGKPQKQAVAIGINQAKKSSKCK